MIFTFDLDKTLCTKKEKNQSYSDVSPIVDMIEMVNSLHEDGHEIIISTARNMVTRKNDVGKVIKNIGKITLEWLEKWDVHYDSIHFGKPYANVYCDDKSIRPHELLELFRENKINTINDFLMNDHEFCELNKQLTKIKLDKYYVIIYSLDNETFYCNYGKGLKIFTLDDSVFYCFIKCNGLTFKDFYNLFDCKPEIIGEFNNEDDAREMRKKINDDIKTTFDYKKREMRLWY